MTFSKDARFVNVAVRESARIAEQYTQKVDRRLARMPAAQHPARTRALGPRGFSKIGPPFTEDEMTASLPHSLSQVYTRS